MGMASQESSRSDKPDQKPLYAGIISTAGVTAWVMQSAIPMNEKMAYLAVVAVGGFAVGIVRFFLTQWERHAERDGRALTRLIQDHERADTMHREMCDALNAICVSLGAEYRLTKPRKDDAE